MFVLLRIKNRPTRQKTWCVIFPTTARKFVREGYICCDTSQLKAQYDLGLDKKPAIFNRFPNGKNETVFKYFSVG